MDLPDLSIRGSDWFAKLVSILCNPFTYSILSQDIEYRDCLKTEHSVWQTEHICLVIERSDFRRLGPNRTNRNKTSSKPVLNWFKLVLCLTNQTISDSAEI